MVDTCFFYAVLIFFYMFEIFKNIVILSEHFHNKDVQ